MTTETTFFGGLSASVTHDATTYRGVLLDRAEIRGPKGGTSIAWRAACRRNHQVSSWCDTRDQAARIAPGYTH